MMLMLDGMYVYIHESINVSLRKHSYSRHTCRPIVKPMVVAPQLITY